MLSNQHFAHTTFAWNWGSDFSIEISTELIIDLKCNELQDGARLPAFWRYVEAWEEASLSTCVRPYTILNPFLSFPFLLQILILMRQGIDFVYNLGGSYLQIFLVSRGRRGLFEFRKPGDIMVLKKHLLLVVEIFTWICWKCSSVSFFPNSGNWPSSIFLPSAVMTGPPTNYWCSWPSITSYTNT